jgi:hypothetical protein
MVGAFPNEHQVLDLRVNGNEGVRRGFEACRVTVRTVEFRRQRRD